MAHIQMIFQDAQFRYMLGRNTFCMGTKYADLRPSDTVKAVNERGVSLGILTVKAIHIGRLSYLLKHYSLNNHGVVEAVNNRKLSLAEIVKPSKYLGRLLKSIYDPHGAALDFFDSNCIVIEFEKT